MPRNDRGTPANSHSGSTGSVSRRNWLRIAGTGSVAALAGCMGGGNGSGSNGGSGKGTTIEYWRWPHSTEPSNKGEDQIVKAFNKGPGAEKNIRVKQVKNPFGDHNQALRTAIGGNDAPAIAWSFPDQLYDYSGKSRSQIEKNAPFTFIEDYISDDFRNQFYEPVWHWQEQRFKGLIGVPFIAGIDPGLMYVNVDAWKAAGLGDLPKESWSYEEYLSAAKKINGVKVNSSTVNGVGVGLSDAASAAQWDTFLTQFSRTAGSLIGTGYQNKNDEYVMTLASDPEVNGWNAYIGTPMKNGWTNNPGAYTRDGIQDPFSAGQIGLLPHATFSRVEFSQEDVNFDIIPFPTKNGEKNYGVYAAGGMNVTFNAFRKEVGGNPKAAMEFIKFRNNAQNQFKWFNTSSQSVPNKEAYKLMQKKGVSDFVKQSRGLEVMDRVDEAFKQYINQQKAIKSRYPDIKLTKGGTPITTVPTSIGSGRVHDAVGGALQRLHQNNNANPTEAITKAEEEWASLIANAPDLKLAKSSSGYNKPKPQSGSLK